MSTLPEMNVLTFKNHGELLKTLASLPKNMVCLVGYVDEKGGIQALDSKLLSTQKAEMVKMIEGMKQSFEENRNYESRSSYNQALQDLLDTLNEGKG